MSSLIGQAPLQSVRSGYTNEDKIGCLIIYLQADTMLTSLTFVYCVIGLAFLFDYINGFHDAANSIATIVSTGVLKPYWAVVWAAFF